MSIVLVLIAIVSVQSGASLAKGLFSALGPEGISALRLALASLLLGAVWRPWRRARALTAAQWRAIAAYGIALGAMNLSFYLALVRLPLGLAVALEFTGPLAVALFSSRRWADLLWASLAVVGVGLILPIAPSSSRAIDPVGVAYALGAGAAWASYILLGKRAGEGAHAGTVTALGMAFATALVLPFGVARAGSALANPALLPMALGVAILSSALPYSLEMIALKSIPARSFGILMSLEPAVAALIGLVGLGERLAPSQWAAIGCVVAASLGSSRGRTPV